jgi:hypothetical protein
MKGERSVVLSLECSAASAVRLCHVRNIGALTFVSHTYRRTTVYVSPKGKAGRH